MTNQRFINIVAAGVLSTGFLSAPTLAEDYYYAAGAVGSTGYQIAIGQARIVNEFVDDVDLSIEETSGGLTGLQYVNSGKADFGTGPADGAQEAYSGTGAFEGNPQTNLRGWMVGFERLEHMVVLADSPIQSWEDLRGTRVSVATKGSGSNLTAERILNTLSLWDSITPYYIAYKDATAALQTGRIDAAYFGTGVPISSLVELGISHPYRILPVTPEDAQKIGDAYPAYRPGVIKAGVYEGLEADVPTIAVYNIGWVNKDVPEDVVYNMTKQIWDHHDMMVQTHASQRNSSVEMVAAALEPALPLHPGAERYYREIGVIE